MPIYEYQCGACKHKFEQLQKVSDPLLEVCPECNEKALRKLVSAAGFRLKGTGWYETDFKDKKPANKGGGDSGKTSEGKKGSDTGTKSSTSSKDSSASSTKSTSTGSSGSSD